MLPGLINVEAARFLPAFLVKLALSPNEKAPVPQGFSNRSYEEDQAEAFSYISST
jgi:hypothetical protein